MVPDTLARSIKHVARAALLPGFACGLLLAAWIAVFYQLQSERGAAHRAGVARSEELAHTLSEHVSHILRQAEHATQLYKLKYQEAQGSLPLAQFVRPDGLLDSVLPARLNLPMARFDALGQRAEAVHGFPAPARMDWFHALAAAGPDTVLASTPTIDPRGAHWMIQIARRLEDARGQFAGALVLQIDPMLFVDDYDRLSLEDQGLLLLMSRSSALAVGRVGDAMFTSGAFDFTPPSDPAAAPAEVLAHGGVDHIARIYSLREVPRFPLLVVIGSTEQVAMAQFERHRRLMLWLTSAASLLILAVTAALLRQSFRLRASVRAAEQARATLRAAAEGSFDGFLVLAGTRDAHGHIDDFVVTDLNERAAAAIGRARDQIVGRRMFDLIPHYRHSGLFERYVHVIETGARLEEETELLVAGAPARWIAHQLVPIPGGMAVTFRDITGRKHSESELRDSRSFLQSLIDHLPLLIAVRRAQDGRILVWNDAAAAITGHPAAQVIGQLAGTAFAAGSVLDPADAARMRAHPAIADSVRALQRPDGSLRQVHTVHVPLFDNAGALEYILSIAEDVTQRHEDEQALLASAAALRESAARLRTIADTLPAMVAYIDADEIYRFHNAAYDREFGGRTVIEGRSIRDTVGPHRYATLAPYIRRALGGETLVFEEEDQHDGKARTMEVTYIPQHGEPPGSVVGFHVMRQDITLQKNEKSHLIRLAQIDPLTGMNNRAGFNERLAQAMAASAADGNLMALLYLDIDRFKPVNDTHGHSVGDALLKAFAGRLAHTVRSTDTIARLGGDEFTVIMERVALPADAEAIARKIVTNMQGAFVLDGLKVSISTSIGLAFYRGGGQSAAALVEQADRMLYKSKQAGRNTYRAA